MNPSTAIPCPTDSRGPCRILTARTARRLHPIFHTLAEALAEVPTLRFVKLYPNRISASNRLSTDGKKNPVVRPDGDDLVAVELLIAPEHQEVQVYAIHSTLRGSGRAMVSAVVGATPPDWRLVVLLDWSGGFWERMAQAYPRLIIA